MVAEFSFDVCKQCGSRDLRQSKIQGIFEYLVSPGLITYRCRSCGRRQFKLINARISPVTHAVVVKEMAAVASGSQILRHVSAAAFSVKPWYLQPTEPVERIEHVAPAVQRASPIAFLVDSGVAVAEPEQTVTTALDIEQIPSAELPVTRPAGPRAPAIPSKTLLRRRRVGAALRTIGRGLVRIRKPVLWAVIVMAGVEVSLQLTAVAVWFANRPQPQHLVLCVGDSYTFGIGAKASDLSYPSDVAKLLRKVDKSWKVVNAGWPDQDSRDTVLSLPGRLVHFRPSLVYIVVGARDSLTRPKVAPADIIKSVSYNFPFLWRTPLFFGKFLNESNSLAAKTSVAYTDRLHLLKSRWNRPPGPSPVGTWLYQGQVVRIQDDALIRFGNIDSHWEVHGNQMSTWPAPGNPGGPMQYQWERRGNVLIVKGGQFPNGLTLQAIDDGEAHRLEAEEARKAAPKPSAEDPTDATVPSADDQTAREEKLRLALSKANPAQQFFIRSDLARTYARNGKRGDATGELNRMRPELDSAGDPEPMVDAFIDTAETIGEGSQALSVARTFSPRYPANASIEKTIAWECYQNRDFDSAAAAIEKALQLTSQGKARAGILNMRARILLDTNVPKSLESVIEAYTIGGDEYALRRQIDPGLYLYNPELLELSFKNVQASFEVRQEVRSAINQLEHRPFGDIGSVMAHHLRLMADMVRTTGAEVVFMSYPTAGYGHVNDVLRRVAAEKQAPWIDVEAAFQNRLKTTPKEELFVPDGHLTDKGYALMSELVVADIRQRKQ